MTSVERSHIPPTDERLRHDQKALEEGTVEEAENIKLEVDCSQFITFLIVIQTYFNKFID